MSFATFIQYLRRVFAAGVGILENGLNNARLFTRFPRLNRDFFQQLLLLSSTQRVSGACNSDSAEQ
jgi:hypothetical protein